MKEYRKRVFMKSKRTSQMYGLRKLKVWGVTQSIYLSYALLLVAHLFVTMHESSDFISVQAFLNDKGLFKFPMRLEKQWYEFRGQSTNMKLFLENSKSTDNFNFSFSFSSKSKDNQKANEAQKLENDLVALITSGGTSRRKNDNDQEIRKIIRKLEEIKGVTDPTLTKNSDVLDGKWRLLFTVSDKTSSPIQRTFIGNENFAVFQEIRTSPLFEIPSVSNVVDLKIGNVVLNVTADASTNSRPLEGFTPRQENGLIFGKINIFGISETTLPSPDLINSRIDFRFSEADFDLSSIPFLPINSIPYPVPFKSLDALGFGDDVKGWIDVTYLSKSMRISKGNKGTTFILIKE